MLRTSACVPIVLGIALGSASAALGAEDPAVKPVTLPLAIQRKLGFVVQPLAAATARPLVPGYARVLDPGPLAQLDADIAAAEAAADASAAEAARARALNAEGQAISAKALEGAVAQARADAVRLALLRRRIGLEWGPGIARLSDGQRGALLARFAAGKAALLRIDTPSGQGQAGPKSAEIDFGPLGVARAAILGPARASDPRLLSPGLLAEVTGPLASKLSIGLAAPVRLTTADPVHGVVAPRAALIRSGGKTWLYVRTGPESFLRKPVQDPAPQPEGLFAAAGLRPGEPVVTQGAAALFAAETHLGASDAD
jgi:hypothetical protein